MQSVEYLEKREVKFKIIHLAEVPKTVKDVARIFGCPLNQVLKTLVFIGSKPILTIVSGDKRVDMEKLKRVFNEPVIRQADPQEVEEVTGYKIGGVSPFGIENNLQKVIDKKVFELSTVNIGNGMAEIGIEMETSELKKALDAIIEDIT